MTLSLLRDTRCSELGIDVQGGVARVTLNRQNRGNSLSRQLLEELGTVCDAIAQDDSVRAIVITGSGDRAFSAGADINGLQGMDSRQGYDLAIHGQGVFDAIEKLMVPSIAAINGVAFGGGLELALACDIRIAATTARFANPEITLENVPGWGATQRLPRVIGVGRAKYLMLTGQAINSDEALACGLISEVVAQEELMSRAQELAASIGARSTLAVSGIKSAIRIGSEGGPSAGQIAEATAVAACCGTPEQVAAVTAFLNKKSAAAQS